MPIWPVADRLDRAVVKPRQEEQDHDAAAHGHHAPELGVYRQHHGDDHCCTADNHALEQGWHANTRRGQISTRQHARDEGVHHLVCDGPQHGVIRREIPDWRNVQRCLERVSRDEVVVLQEITTHFRSKEHNSREHHQEHADCKDVVHRVVRMERDPVHWFARGVTLGLDLDAIRVVGADLVQGDDVCHHQAQQHQGHRDHVKAEEAVKGSVTHHKITANQQGQIRADKRNCRKQVDDHLGTPVAHLAPGQQIAHEGFSHQHQENTAAKQPDQFTWLAVAAIDQAAEHVQVDHDKKG